MKKILLVLFAVMFMTGCGNNVSEINVESTQNTIEETLKNMKSVNDESLEDVYGLDLSLMEVHVIKQNSDGDFYAIIKTKNKTEVKNDMEKYFDKIQKFNTNYSPERLQILDNRVEKEIGDYLIYIVSENADAVYDNILNDL